MAEPVEVWVVGVARPGHGAFAWASQAGGHGEGVEDDASQARMELRACVEGLQATDAPFVCVVSSSQLLVNTGRTWLDGWRAAGWRKKGGIANVDLVKALAEQMDAKKIAWDLVSKDEIRVEVIRERAKHLLDAAPKVDKEAPKGRPEVPETCATVLIYTDGGCRGNPGGRGGWGALMVHVPTDKARAMRGGEPESTNNRMEMSGAIFALEALTAANQTIEIRSDSKYLVDMCTKWMPGWKRNGWKRKISQPGDDGVIKNLDLVKRLDALLAKHPARFTWVRGHSGEPGNEIVDALTNAAMDDVAKGKSGAHDQRFDPSPIKVRAGK